MSKETFPTEEQQEQRYCVVAADPNTFCCWKENDEQGYHVYWVPQLSGGEDI
jgi:hypothetical protein